MASKDESSDPRAREQLFRIAMHEDEQDRRMIAAIRRKAMTRGGRISDVELARFAQFFIDSRIPRVRARIGRGESADAAIDAEVGAIATIVASFGILPRVRDGLSAAVRPSPAPSAAAPLPSPAVEVGRTPRDLVESALKHFGGNKTDFMRAVDAVKHVSHDTFYRLLRGENIRDLEIREVIATVIHRVTKQPCTADDLIWPNPKSTKTKSPRSR